MPNYREQFPDFPANAMPVIPESFADTSWRNDACPSFSNGELIIWVDYPKPEDRELSDTKRFTVGPLDTDDWEEVLRFVTLARCQNI